MQKLIWLTDLHLASPGSAQTTRVDPLESLRACLTEIRECHDDALRLIVTGDLVQTPSGAAYGLLKAELDSLGLPYRLLAGNHDDRKFLANGLPGSTSSDFVQGVEELSGTRLLYLDTLSNDGRHYGELCASRMEWLRGQVESAEGHSLLVFLHHPPVEIGVPGLDRLRLHDVSGLAEVISKRDSPTHLFCGHVHRNVSGTWAGHPFATLKSTHMQYELDMTSTALNRSNEPAGYAVVQFGREGIVVNYRDVVRLARAG